MDGRIRRGRWEKIGSFLVGCRGRRDLRCSSVPAEAEAPPGRRKWRRSGRGYWFQSLHGREGSGFQFFPVIDAMCVSFFRSIRYYYHGGVIGTAQIMADRKDCF
ncbi:hypothetical protein VPH35_014766 [Triticum aestivum]